MDELQEISVGKVSMSLNMRTQNLKSNSVTVGYLNTELYNSSDPAVVSAFKDNCRQLGRNLAGLTNNTLLNIVLKTEEDITTGGE